MGNRRISWIIAAGLTTAALAAGGACSSSSDNGGTGGATGSGGAGGAATQTLYDKYGGAATITKVVDDAVAGVLGDCELTPYFAVVGQSGHDSAERLKSCLRLQFTALLGGPASYPGTNDRGETCADMRSIHTGLAIPGHVFDKFMSDLAGVLATDGVSAGDIATMAGALNGIRSDVVAAAPVEKTACDAGAADAAGSGG